MHIRCFCILKVSIFAALLCSLTSTASAFSTDGDGNTSSYFISGGGGIAGGMFLSLGGPVSAFGSDGDGFLASPFYAPAFMVPVQLSSFCIE